jgi:subtilisin family serine protease
MVAKGHGDVGQRVPASAAATVAGQPVATLAVPSDPYLARQWHLIDRDSGLDLNVRAVWKAYSGAGVTVGIWDDGIEYTHPDLDGNYARRLHIRLDGERHDPFPEARDANHGTAVAGIIAAEADGRGTVGVAWGATIAGVDHFHDPSLDTDRSFLRLSAFDVTNHSWGYDEPFVANLADPAWAGFFAGWQRSVVEGRGGLGTINVVSAGNSRAEDRDANHSNLSNMPEVITVAALGIDGDVAEYSNPGACVLVAAPSDDWLGGGIWTTDRTGRAGYSTGRNEPDNRDPGYTATFGGTSAAAPAVSGVVALMLEANPGLGWRDVQEILALSARHVGASIGAGPWGDELHRWSFNGAETWNGGGMHFSNDYGFGLVDALAAVRLAESWTGRQTSANWLRQDAEPWAGSRTVPDDDPRGIRIAIASEARVEIEQVALRLTIEDGYTGDYQVVLVSPDGTRSLLSAPGSAGTSNTGDWLYTSNAFRGEGAVGTWRVAISDRWVADEGRLVAAELSFSGSAESPGDRFVFTDAFSDHAGRRGHATVLRDRDGGIDTINAAAVGAASRIDLGAGSGRIDGVRVGFRGDFEAAVGGDGDDLLLGGALAERLAGGRGADTLAGRAAADRLLGDSGPDVLRGGGGADVLRGGAGADRLADGAGPDRLVGGAGADLFRLGRDGLDDRIDDFRPGVDRIAIEGAGFADLAIRARAGEIRVVHDGERLLLGGRLAAADLAPDDFLLA